MELEYLFMYSCREKKPLRSSNNCMHFGFVCMKENTPLLVDATTCHNAKWLLVLEIPICIGKKLLFHDERFKIKRAKCQSQST